MQNVSLLDRMIRIIARRGCIKTSMFLCEKDYYFLLNWIKLNRDLIEKEDDNADSN